MVHVFIWCMQSSVCKHISDSRGSHLFASAQCLGYSFEFGRLTDDLCFPPKTTVLNQVKRAVWKLGAKAVFVAADRDAMIDDFQTIVTAKVRRHVHLVRNVAHWKSRQNDAHFAYVCSN